MDYAVRLERRIEVVESRVRAKYSPARVHDTVTRIRRHRSGEIPRIDL